MNFSGPAASISSIVHDRLFRDVPDVAAIRTDLTAPEQQDVLVVVDENHAAGSPQTGCYQTTSRIFGPRSCSVLRHSKWSLAGRISGNRSSSVLTATSISVRASDAPMQ